MLALIATATAALTLAGAELPGRLCEYSSGFGESAFYNEDSQRVILRIEERHIKGTPTWTPGKGEVPLSPNQAYRAALDHITSVKPGIKGLKLYEIVLMPVACNGIQSAHYSVAWVVEPERGVFKGYVRLGVLLDGKVVAPIAASP